MQVRITSLENEDAIDNRIRIPQIYIHKNNVVLDSVSLGLLDYISFFFSLSSQSHTSLHLHFFFFFLVIQISITL